MSICEQNNAFKVSKLRRRQTAPSSCTLLTSAACVISFNYSRPAPRGLNTTMSLPMSLPCLGTVPIISLKRRKCPYNVFSKVGNYGCVNFRRSMIDVMCRLSKIDVSPFEDRCVALRRSMSRCVDLRRSMCRLSKIDVSPFGDGCVDLRRPMMDVSTSKIGD